MELRSTSSVVQLIETMELRSTLSVVQYEVMDIKVGGIGVSYPFKACVFIQSGILS